LNLRTGWSGWRYARAAATLPIAMMCTCVLSIPSAVADPSSVDLDAIDSAAATVARGLSPERRQSFVTRVRFARLETGNEERLCRPQVREERLCKLHARSGASPAVTMTPTEFDPAPNTSAVDIYLCGVYWRMPHKIDDAGDFSWKDGAAAERAERTVCDYAINGMHPDLREALYALGHKADEAGINWSMLSAFRDDYRQSIASGFKAEPCGSWHGGSCKTKGWGDGRAADLWIADANGYPIEDAAPLLDLIDKLGPSLGLSRPLRGADPPHVQVSGDWQEIARTLREQRQRVPESTQQAVSQR
jgi:hypothetical protein